MKAMAPEQPPVSGSCTALTAFAAPVEATEPRQSVIATNANSRANARSMQSMVGCCLPKLLKTPGRTASCSPRSAAR